MPLWDGERWNLWTDMPDGQFMKLAIVETARSNYLATSPANEHDLHIPFVEFMWQQASWPEVSKQILAICDDFHQLATIAAKLDHFFEARQSIGSTLLDSFVKSEIEQLVVVARSIFDLLHEVISHFWNDRVALIDPVMESLRKQNKTPETFRKLVLDGGRPRSAEDISNKYALPLDVSRMYVKHTPFFLPLRNMRDGIVHQGKSVDTIFVTDKGFCVDPKSRYFSNFAWKSEHYFNENIASLRPWTGHIISQTIDACSEIMFSLAAAIPFPPPIAPGHHIFIRNPSNKALIDLLSLDKGMTIWPSAKNNTSA